MSVSHNDIDEQEMLARLQLGEEMAFRWVYDRYSRAIYGNILRLVHDETVADDLLQDVFVKIWEHREHIDPNQSFRAYLFTCSRHFAFNFRRRLQLEIEAAIQMARGYVDSDDTVVDSLNAKETEALLHGAISELPTQRQRIFRMCKVDGLSYRQVAEQLGISEATVRDHIVKANKFIKDRLIQGGGYSALLLTLWLLTTS
ncbi:RNA polymerase sigma-70 factor, ECF subfamily [Parapedobacter indicus]|uniref:RNA polymerase sigma-70 factor, ECF subfamily n=2 Tax=Parapedobacter indicus TaxID=1477437 RepID=A0A1I3IK63_9SPHI|nr:RNA polymerase sigma-70 factor (ECF subfamily) [Parapedobacter indicus]SFI48259.1 RNA polymerase sigma-70 factor, ECF subfamily [Parapedobacter indicus]